jgi:predicted GNAT family acetyltransferase
MNTRIVDNSAAGLFEIHVDGVRGGFTEYTRARTTLSLIHTEIDAEFEGRGLGSQLVRGVLDEARAAGDTVLPFCPFIRAFLGRHPEYLDLVPADQRTRFGLEAAASGSP